MIKTKGWQCNECKIFYLSRPDICICGNDMLVNSTKNTMIVYEDASIAPFSRFGKSKFALEVAQKCNDALNVDGIPLPSVKFVKNVKEENNG